MSVWTISIKGLVNIGAAQSCNNAHRFLLMLSDIFLIAVPFAFLYRCFSELPYTDKSIDPLLQRSYAPTEFLCHRLTLQMYL